MTGITISGPQAALPQVAGQKSRAGQPVFSAQKVGEVFGKASEKGSRDAFVRFGAQEPSESNLFSSLEPSFDHDLGPRQELGLSPQREANVAGFVDKLTAGELMPEDMPEESRL